MVREHSSRREPAGPKLREGCSLRVVARQPGHLVQLGSPIERIDNLVGRGIDQKKAMSQRKLQYRFFALAAGAA